MNPIPTKITTYSRHVYDVDIINTHYKLCELVEESNDLKKGIDKNEYYKNSKAFIKTYCNIHGIDFDHFFNSRLPIIIESTEASYEFNLGLMLIWLDSNKIFSFLNYQKEKYSGNENFINLLDYRIYDIVKDNSPINNDERLKRIMEWVEKQKSNNDTPPPDEDKKNGYKESYLIWNENSKKKNTKLKKIHKALINDFIDNIDYKIFELHFKGKPQGTYINWKKKQYSLLYLIGKLNKYLDVRLYNNKDNSPSITQIAQHFYWHNEPIKVENWYSVKSQKKEEGKTTEQKRIDLIISDL